VTPCKEDACVDNQGCNEVDEYTANHNEEALPSRFRTKLVGLHGLLHLLGVHGFVNHPCNLHITAEGKPPEVVICTFVRKEFEGEPGVKEEAEFLYTNLKKACEKEVPSFVKRNK
jgi:hypothetical protein